MSSLPYYRWRPFCGTSLLAYALELRQREDATSGVMLRDLFNCVSQHAAMHYGVTDVPSLPENASRNSIVKAIAAVSCRVRQSLRFREEVKYVTSVEEFSDLLAQAFKYFNGEPDEKVRRAQMANFHVVSGCHNDGALYLEKHVPDLENQNGGKPHRRVYFFAGNLHQLLCDFTFNHEEYLEQLYELLHKSMSHVGTGCTTRADAESEGSDDDVLTCGASTTTAAPAAAAQ